MNWSSNRVEDLYELTSDIVLYLFANIFMARQFESQSKGWHNYPGHIGRLEAIERFPSYQSDKIKTTPDEDECIYYPLVYGQEEKLKIIVNPQGYGRHKKSQSNSQSPFMKSSLKENKNKSYGTDDDGCYEILRGSTVVQSSPPSRHHLGSRVAGQDLPAPVSRSVLRALSNDFEPNKHRVLTLQPSKVCRQHQLNVNNNYERPKKANNSGHFVSPHADDGLNSRGNGEQLLDNCTCMCCVKGFFYHLTKDCENEGNIVDQPCSCAGPLSQCLPRWGCLAIFSLFFPCLWCYLPVKGCMKLQQCSSKTQNDQMWK